MNWEILVAIILFLISITGIVYFGNLLVDLLERIFHNHLL